VLPNIKTPVMTKNLKGKSKTVLHSTPKGEKKAAIGRFEKKGKATQLRITILELLPVYRCCLNLKM
jgi:hypothetical protein